MDNDEKAAYIEDPVMKEYNVQPYYDGNVTDDDENPTGGEYHSQGLHVYWQNGARGQEGTDELLPPNGAFVEDVINAALQRLKFFQTTKFRDRGNAIAITHLEGALDALRRRTVERQARQVEGKHEV